MNRDYYLIKLNWFCFVLRLVFVVGLNYFNFQVVSTLPGG